MTFNLSVAGQQPKPKPKPKVEETFAVEFSLRKNADDSIGILMQNKAFGNEPAVEVARMLTTGELRLNSFARRDDPRCFLRTDRVFSSAYSSPQEFMKVIRE